MTTPEPTPNPAADFQALVTLAHREHVAGRLAESATAYRQVLALRPDVAEVYDNLGNVLRDQGQFDAALAMYERAVAIKPLLPAALNNLGNMLKLKGRLPEAAARFQQALAQQPDLAEARHNLGNVLWRQGRLDEATTQYEQALAIRPGLAPSHNELGCVLWQQGQLDAALARFQQALAINPRYVEAICNLASVLKDQGHRDQAATHYRQALALKPDYFQAAYNLGNVLAEQGRAAEAIEFFQRAVAVNPRFAAAHTNLGSALVGQGRFDEARAHFEQAVALQPNFAQTHHNLGNVLMEQQLLDQALACFTRALAIDPRYPDALNSLAGVLLRQGQLDNAAARYEEALSHRPDYAEALYNLSIVRRQQGRRAEAQQVLERLKAFHPNSGEAKIGIALNYLIEGDYERGWPAYEGRLDIPGFVQTPDLPRWQGESLTGRRLLLVAEQGLGDTLHFLRYAKLLKQQGAEVVLAVQAPLSRLLAGHPDLDELVVVALGDPWPRADFYLHLLSAAGALGTDAASIPREVPYLRANPQLVEVWRERLAAIEGLKVGIAWQGSTAYLADRQRSIPLAEFAPLAAVPGVRLISLQKGFGAEQIAAVDFPVVDIGDQLDAQAGPLVDTAAVMQNLDLVVTADTAICHLAGALGVPTWIAHAHSADWRWLLEREDSPWYPTVRLFRQTAPGDWPEVMRRIAAALPALLPPAT